MFPKVFEILWHNPIWLEPPYCSIVRVPEFLSSEIEIDDLEMNYIDMRSLTVHDILSAKKVQQYFIFSKVEKMLKLQSRMP